MINTKIVRMVECSDWETPYGFLVIKTKDIELSDKDVQDAIYNIKSCLANEGHGDDYTVSDIVDRLPSNWDVESFSDSVVEV